jgi:hypothetical protein
LKSPVRENRPPGSVRGASGNRRPYLDSYLNPAAIIIRERVMVKEKSSHRRSRPVIDHPEFKLFVPSESQ